MIDQWLFDDNYIMCNEFFVNCCRDFVVICRDGYWLFYY